MSKMNGKVQELLISSRTLKPFAILVAIIRVVGKSPGMIRAMKNGPKKKAKTLSPKTNGRRNGLKKKEEQRSNAQSGERIRRGTKSGRSNGEKFSLLRKEKSGQTNGSSIGTKGT